MAKAKAKAKKKASGTKAAQTISAAKASAKKKISGYKAGKEYKAAEKLQGMTIQDIAKKYGFDFSRGYADKQAETAAAGQRNIYNSQSRENKSMNKTNMDTISNNYDSAASSLDKGYFQQFLGTKQSQADRGLNAGIAANQNLQLAMNKQGEVADLWKQRNLNTQEESMRFSNTNQTISEALAQVEKEKAMNAQNIYQGLLKQGYDILSSDRASANQWADSAWNRTTFDINNDMDFAKMNIADIYNEQQRADAAAARAAAAAASRRSSGGGGGSRRYSSSSGPAKTSLTPSVNKYNSVVKRQQQTPLDKYYNSPAVKAGQRTGSPYFRTPVAPANNPNLTAWDKYKMLGL